MKIPYVDLADFKEDSRIRLIAHRVKDHDEVVGFMVDNDGVKADRYIEKLKKIDPEITVVCRQKDYPVKGVEFVKVTSKKKLQ